MLRNLLDRFRGRSAGEQAALIGAGVAVGGTTAADDDHDLGGSDATDSSYDPGVGHDTGAGAFDAGAGGFDAGGGGGFDAGGGSGF